MPARAANRYLDLFIAGAGGFVGTFAIMHSLNHRRVFLLLTLPQLLRCAREPGRAVAVGGAGRRRGRRTGLYRTFAAVARDAAYDMHRRCLNVPLIRSGRIHVNTRR